MSARTEKARRHILFQNLFPSGALRFAALGILIFGAGAGLCWYLAGGGSSKVNEGLAELKTAFLTQRRTKRAFRR